MTEFKQELRHYCRNPKCRSKLPSPVENPREAFCARGCYRSFYLKRCVVCEGPIERKTGNQKVCKKAKCRSAWKAGLGFGCYATSNDAKLMQEVPGNIDPKPAPAGDRAAVSPWLPKGLLKPTADLAPWRWERMTGPNGEWREDDDWQLLDRDGRMVARVRQEGSGYWAARPRIIPEPPIESFEAACRRAVNIAIRLWRGRRASVTPSIPA
jgi:hypothetical protein